MPHTLLLLSPLAGRGGNYCTINRIRGHLQSCGYACHLKDPESFSSENHFRRMIANDKIQLLIGIHALRTGVTMKETNLPYLLIMGGTDLNVFCEDPDAMISMTQAVFKARFVVCFSQSSLTRITTLWADINPNKVKVIPQAVETNPSNFDLTSYLQHHLYQQDLDLTSALSHEMTLNNGDLSKAIIFVFIGGIRPVKNPTYLVNMFQEWHKKDQRILYLIVGPRLDQNYTSRVLETAVKRLPGIVYIPGLRVSDAHKVISESFALVNSSDSEGMSLAVLEAMQLGVPVLARNIPGNKDVIRDGQTGILYDTPQSFYDKAQQLISDRTLRQSLIDNAKEYVENQHSIAYEEEQYRQLVDKCLQSVHLDT